MPRRKSRITRSRRKGFKLSKIKPIFWVGAFLFLIFYLLILKDLPSPTKLASPTSFPISTKIYDRNNKLLYDIYVEKNRNPIKLSELPSYIKFATIASEDKDFYKHGGFALRGILRAMFNTVFHRKLQGG